MQISEIDPKDFLEFIPEEGMIKLSGQRVLIFDAVALGLLRKELIFSFGYNAARGILTRLGYTHGWRTAELLRSQYPAIFAENQAGSYLHMLFGLTKACNFSDSSEVDPDTLIEVHWENSYEAEQHKLLIGDSEDPICWTLTGFASGYESCKHDREVYFIEDKCCCAGDKNCRIVGKFKEDWGEKLAPHKAFYKMESADSLLKDLTQELKETERNLKRKQEKLGLVTANIHNISGFITRSHIMKQIIELARRVAKVNSSVVVSGESGVGKERVSRYIHEHSSRANKPFVAVNCGAITETLLESELFGHKKGAFTGAESDRLGLFEQAHDGTLFLDEVGEISPSMQVKLLRVLQEKSVRAVGSNTEKTVDVRIIAATNRDLKVEVEAKRFREDLYYRLCVVELVVPPLRDRSEDILYLATAILKQTNKDMGREVKGFSPQATKHLLGYSWPGNVRELQNVIERSVALSISNEITVLDLPDSLNNNRDFLPNTSTKVVSLDKMEEQYILSVLDMCDGNKRKAMDVLKIGKTTLYRKLQKYQKKDK